MAWMNWLATAHSRSVQVCSCGVAVIGRFLRVGARCLALVEQAREVAVCREALHRFLLGQFGACVGRHVADREVQTSGQGVEGLSERFKTTAHALHRLVIRPPGRVSFGLPGSGAPGDNVCCQKTVSSTSFRPRRSFQWTVRAFGRFTNCHSVLMRRPMGGSTSPDHGVKLCGSEGRKVRVRT